MKKSNYYTSKKRYIDQSRSIQEIISSNNEIDNNNKSHNESYLLNSHNRLDETDDDLFYNLNFCLDSPNSFNNLISNIELQSNINYLIRLEYQTEFDKRLLFIRKKKKSIRCCT